MPTTRTRPSAETAKRNFRLAVLSIGVVPWLPMIIEWVIEWYDARPITVTSLVLTLACYSITVALSTNDRFLCILLLLLSAIESSFYGALLVTAPHDTLRQTVLIAVLSFLGVLTFASVWRERKDRHIHRHEEFFEWLKVERR